MSTTPAMNGTMTRPSTTTVFGSLLLVVGLAGVALTSSDAGAASGAPSRAQASIGTPDEAVPVYDDEGRLLRPERFEEWVLVGTSIGLSYSEEETPARRGPDDPPGRFHNVLMPGWALEAYRETGAFPERTMLALGIYDVGTSAPPRERGFYQGELVGLELHVKDSDRFETGWGFFGFDPDPADDRAEVVPSDRDCYTCHAEHAAQDDVFTQFYPLLRGPEPAGPGR